MAEYIERLKKNEYLKGWHDALTSALKESYKITSEQGKFKVIQEETIIGLGLSKDSPIHEIEPIADVIEIPKNATNGDVIKAMFPNIEADEIKTDTGGYIEVKYLDTTDKCDATAFRKNWWNAPYAEKRGSENE